MKHLSKEQIEAITKKLASQRSITLEKIQEYSSQLNEIVDNGKDENGIENTGYNQMVEFLVNGIDRYKKHLGHIENALIRLSNNTYGYCAETGHPISYERLFAVPTTTLSMEGKERRQLHNN